MVNYTFPNINEKDGYEVSIYSQIINVNGEVENSQIVIKKKIVVVVPEQGADSDLTFFVLSLVALYLILTVTHPFS